MSVQKLHLIYDWQFWIGISIFHRKFFWSFEATSQIFEDEGLYDVYENADDALKVSLSFNKRCRGETEEGKEGISY